MIGSVALLLRHSLNLNEEANLLEQAIYDAIEGGARTADIATNNENILTTDEMTNVIISRLIK
jgi:3-isopropylmalate dehydrogenase